MGTQSNFSADIRKTKDVNDRERKLIRDSKLGYRELARMYGITEDQVRYIRSSEGRQAHRATSIWSEGDDALLLVLYEEYGWKPSEIAQWFKDKNYAQVYRKMSREFRGK